MVCVWTTWKDPSTIDIVIGPWPSFAQNLIFFTFFLERLSIGDNLIVAFLKPEPKQQINNVFFSCKIFVNYADYRCRRFDICKQKTSPRNFHIKSSLLSAFVSTCLCQFILLRHRNFEKLFKYWTSSCCLTSRLDSGNVVNYVLLGKAKILKGTKCF